MASEYSLLADQSAGDYTASQIGWSGRVDPDGSRTATPPEAVAYQPNIVALVDGRDGYLYGVNIAAGTYAETLGIHRVSEMNRVGRRLPKTMAAFTVAALGMIGVPPVAGFISKWYLGAGALDANMPWILVILAVSSALNAAYFLPILYRAWFMPATGAWQERLERGRFETHWMLLMPPLVTAALALLYGLAPVLLKLAAIALIRNFTEPADAGQPVTAAAPGIQENAHVDTSPDAYRTAGAARGLHHNAS